MDLEEFSFWFPKGSFHAVAEGPSVLLTGDGFHACDTPDQARGLAAQLLDEFGATISLLWPSYRAPSLGTVHERMPDGTRHGTAIGMVGMAVGRSKARATSTVPPGTDPGPTQAQALWAAAKSAPRLEVALLLWADPARTWPRLYRILEELEAHLEQTLSSAGLCSANERARFTRSANTAEVAGNESRHAGGKFQPPAKPMSLREASGFVRTMLTKVLQARSTSQRSGNAA